MDLEDVELTHQCSVHYDHGIHKWLSNYSERKRTCSKSSEMSFENISENSFEVIGASDSDSDVKLNSNPLKGHVKTPSTSEYLASIGMNHYTASSIDDWLLKPEVSCKPSDLVSFACCKAGKTDETPCTSFQDCACMRETTNVIANCANRLISMEKPAWNAWLVQQPIVPDQVKEFITRNELHETKLAAKKETSKDLPQELKCWLATYKQTEPEIDPQENAVIIQNEQSQSTSDVTSSLADKIDENTSLINWLSSQDTRTVADETKNDDNSSALPKSLSFTNELSRWLWPSVDHREEFNSNYLKNIWAPEHQYNQWLDKSSLFDYSKWLFKPTGDGGEASSPSLKLGDRVPSGAWLADCLGQMNMA